ncbi:hypothetical protein SASPL_116536 [Salvia splendens]|uniref:Uncharacterized protein n=1 Tax=Salvia splendens TaxID=180675 RepID=A0A8X8XWK5_SALSN|nr:hypothetical protein SASPL_116536 [Salvia splendens]
MKKESRGGKSEMSFNKNPLRPFGQRSITSTPLFRASNRSNGCEQNAGIKAPTAKGSRISLSDFLNRKLHRSSVLPTSVEIIDIDDIEPTGKRKCLFEDHDDKLTGRKRVLILGDDSKPRRSSPRKVFTNGESKPFFNHYDNGGGWWDENMAGVDNEEVGCNDVWEGVDCTTLGGIEWH